MQNLTSFAKTHKVFMEVVMEQQMMQRMFSMYVKLDAKIYIYVDNVWMLVDMRNMYDIDSYARGKL